MKKILFALLLAFVFVLSSTIISFADNPATLEAPQNVNVFYDDGLQLRWTMPQSIVNAIENEEWDIIASIGRLMMVHGIIMCLK